MASMTNAFETNLMLLLFNNDALTNVGNAGGLLATSADGSTQLSLHTTALTDASTLMTTNQIAYTGYARPTQPRDATATGWDVTSGAATNKGIISFQEMTGGAGGTAVHVGLGFIATGDQLDLHADLTADLAVTAGITPQFAISALSWTAA